MWKMNHMKGNEKTKHYGKYISFIIKDLDIFTNYITKRKKFPKNFMIIVFKKNGQMQTLLPNGKNKVMKSCVVYSVFNRKITILKQLVFAEFLKQSLKKENSYNVIIADAEDVHLEIETSHKLIFVLAYLYIYLYTLSLSLEKERKN